MHPAPRNPLGEEPLVEPGTGPFRIKATGYLGHMRWVSEHFPGGTSAYLSQLSPAMCRFFEQQFLAVSFVDLMPLVCAGHTCARALDMSFFDFIVYRSRNQAEQDLHGVFRMLLKLTSPKLVAAWIPMILAQYFDFGEAHVSYAETHKVMFELTNMPLIFSDWLHAAYEGFSSVLVEATGGVAPSIDLRVSTGKPLHGYAGCNLSATLRWS